eukprot:CAMPEP_0118718240 /NCGR_PEP_ID=MMETSP0800-20121206/28682_1 /TAXON_ID=210618 ORGANISM="Striatella unipunctata, Strain CCMP2910" /NCGR_SAMPLE_ID=MMETSP0800 /ASSEMBLY_ACC=CAM_ASM_000638 /LENGTH=58 /DNA_ID=CAMNT_0006625221 /DNA_START=82 /DNA_END=255 /DNA_ORIENTATION=-
MVLEATNHVKREYDILSTDRGYGNCELTTQLSTVEHDISRAPPILWRVSHMFKDEDGS